MAPRIALGNTVVRLAGLASALVLLLGLGPDASRADTWIPPRANAPREVDLLKPPHEDLRITWSALVHEEGGEFLISRQGIGGPPSVVARVRPRVDGRYEVAERGEAGSWIYKLRYRDRRGREHLLVTIRLNVERLDRGRGILTANVGGPPAAVMTAAGLPLPTASIVSYPAAAQAAADGPGRWPPTPPP
jgi:hypothetical protein